MYTHICIEEYRSLGCISNVLVLLKRDGHNFFFIHQYPTFANLATAWSLLVQHKQHKMCRVVINMGAHFGCVCFQSD